MQALTARLGLPKEKIQIRLARMGGGFGQRAYGHHLVEAAVISQKLNAPIKLVYTREDDMSYGIYRPTYTATYKAALDKDNNLIAFQLRGGGIPEHPVAANRFPAGAVDNYLAEGWEIESNITLELSVHYAPILLPEQSNRSWMRWPNLQAKILLIFASSY